MARVSITIPIQNIYTRRKLPLSYKVLQFAIKLLLGQTFPPVHVKRDAQGRYVLLDGRNRTAAHKLAGKTTINAILGIHEDPYPYKEVRTRKDTQIPKSKPSSRIPTYHPDN